MLSTRNHFVKFRKLRCPVPGDIPIYQAGRLQYLEELKGFPAGEGGTHCERLTQLGLAGCGLQGSWAAGVCRVEKFGESRDVGSSYQF
ncbi:hypothetical protein, unlikely [Trypanosoma brucei brucei TREU927]|uniref:Uncharacterized protein n=1 Tax=Trypanosoma brucei brucei (strain 927/4 GUTat10.1) TaxID=185431 RepID=Q38FG0_TRYB2|nr:hypothetical protein, unlikely [Trypanosoma brucei brucei TREU927]EAN76460.1 hypothetical protein, unlikely [Trypanosoma brucei brucei TREU927]